MPPVTSPLPAPAGPSRLRGERVAVLDAARGVAIVAMVVYHFVWDLGFLGLIAQPLALTPPWQSFARVIAASFLLLVGVSLWLAHGDAFRGKSFLRRLGWVSAGAALVSGATFLAIPQGWVFFGILHAIALFSVLAVPFLRLPIAVVGAAAVLVFAMPWWVTGVDHALLTFLGLSSRPPRTNDFVPVFPWFGFVLCGVILARLARRAPRLTAAATWRAPGAGGRLLVAAGRHSLPVYLVHQPLLIALLWPLTLFATPDLTREEKHFAEAFEASCLQAGGTLETCDIAFGCWEESLKAAGLWQAAVQDRLDAAGQGRAMSLVRSCWPSQPQPLSPPPG